MSSHWFLTPTSPDQPGYVAIDFNDNLIHVASVRQNVHPNQPPGIVVHRKRVFFLETPTGPRSPEAVDDSLTRRCLWGLTERSSRLGRYGARDAEFARNIANLLYIDHAGDDPFGEKWLKTYGVGKDWVKKFPMLRRPDFAARVTRLNSAAFFQMPAR